MAKVIEYGGESWRLSDDGWLDVFVNKLLGEGNPSYRGVIRAPYGPVLWSALKAASEAEALRENLWHDFIEQRIGNRPPCSKCQGLGVRAYASTSGWRGGPGGQAITGGTCDACWGSGTEARPGVDLRRYEASEKREKALRDALDAVVASLRYLARSEEREHFLHIWPTDGERRADEALALAAKALGSPTGVLLPCLCDGCQNLAPDGSLCQTCQVAHTPHRFPTTATAEE